jgi:hypothetical protein
VLIRALANIEPCAVTGRITASQLAIALGEQDIWPESLRDHCESAEVIKFSRQAVARKLVAAAVAKYSKFPISEKVREARLRRFAKRLGYYVCKSRNRAEHCNNHGGYMLVEGYTNTVHAGADFGILTLDDLESWLNHIKQREAA